MKKYISTSIIVCGLLVGMVVIAQNTASEIVFPVAELDNCQNKAECKAYCNRPENDQVCFEFAKRYGLLPEEEIRLAEQVLGVQGGPGGCASRSECETYCNNVSHLDECLLFAEEHGLMREQELEEAKKIRSAIQSGVQLPGGCQNKEECKQYCENPEYAGECLTFAEAVGFIPPEEIEQARKMLPLMQRGETPGRCQSREACEVYCESDEHFAECIEFGTKHGLIPEEAREHIEAFKRAGGRGPGGCVGRQCEAYCEKPENQQSCFEWARNHGVLSESDVRRMEEGKKHIEQALTNAPPEVQRCIEEAIGGLEKLRSGDFFGGPETGKRVKTCFEEEFGGFGPPPSGGSGESFPPGEHFEGPGGCQSPEECRAYCEEYPEECTRFGPEGNFTQPSRQHAGPGGCQSIDECIKYCKKHPEVCRGFNPPHAGTPDINEGQPHQDFPPPYDEFQNAEQFQEYDDFQRQHKQEFQKQFEMHYQDQYQQEFQQQYDQYQQFKDPYQDQYHEEPRSALPHPFALILSPFIELFIR